MVLRPWIRAGLATLLLTSTQLLGWSPDELRTQALRDLDVIESHFALCYAPRDWKLESFGWSIEDAVAEAKDKILSCEDLTLRDCQHIIRGALRSSRDYHVGICFYSAEKSTLPFSIRGVDGRYFISYIDRDRLPHSSFPFSVGDELLEFDGRSTWDQVEEIKRQYFFGAAEGTDQMLAELMLCDRQASRGHDIPRGSIDVSIQAEGKKARRHQLSWEYSPELLRSPRLRQNAESVMSALKMEIAPDLLFSSTAENPHSLGARDTFLPPLGKLVWKTSPDSAFQACIYQTPDRKQIGFLRISSYVLDDCQELRAILARFEEFTDGLVIDQMNNPGGNLFFAYSLVSMLGTEARATPRMRFMLTQDLVEGAFGILTLLESVESDSAATELLGDSFHGYPVTYQFCQFMRDYARFIIEEWEAASFLTEPGHAYGIDWINPNPQVQYSKPVLMLMNHLSFSCGDMVPAVLKGSENIRLMGTCTAGAGGRVEAYSFPNRCGIERITLTRTLAVDLEQNPIENRGVEPDIAYEVTCDDIRTGFAPFAAAVAKEMDAMITEGAQ